MGAARLRRHRRARLPRRDACVLRARAAVGRRAAHRGGAARPRVAERVRLSGLQVRPQRHAALAQLGFQLAHTEVPVEARGVQDRADDRGLGAAVREPGRDVVDVTRAARRDDRDVDGIGDGPGDLEVVTGRGAVAVDAVHDDLARAELLTAMGPFERVEPGRLTGAVDEDLVARRDARTGADVLDLGAEHDALPAERLGAVPDDLRIPDGHRVDADLLGARLEHVEHVVDRPDAAAHGERDEYVAGDTAHGLEVDLALLGAGGDVVEDDLVDLVVVEPGGEILGGGDGDVVPELLRLRDSPVDHVEAGDEALGQHRPSQAAKSASRRRPRPPLFSPWNCVATTFSCVTTDANSTPYSVRPSA